MSEEITRVQIIRIGTGLDVMIKLILRETSNSLFQEKSHRIMEVVWI